MNKQTTELVAQLRDRGFSTDEALSLRKISMTFHRWNEAECGDGNDYASWSIERDEETGIPYRCIYPHSGEMHRHRIPDREKGAQKRLAKIMEQHPDFMAYEQGDPRGASLYIVRKSDLNGGEIRSLYTRGIAICD
jgi:hypothetical protein